MKILCSDFAAGLGLQSTKKAEKGAKNGGAGCRISDEKQKRYKYMGKIKAC